MKLKNICLTVLTFLFTAASAFASSTKIVCQLHLDGVEAASWSMVNETQQSLDTVLEALRDKKELRLVDSVGMSTVSVGGNPVFIPQVKLAAFLQPVSGTTQSRIVIEALAGVENDRTEWVLASFSLQNTLLEKLLVSGLDLQAALPKEQQVQVSVNEGGVFLWVNLGCSAVARAD